MSNGEFIQENREIMKYMRSLPLLTAFQEEDLKALLKRSKMIKYKPGELIVEEGAYHNWIFFLVYGKVGVLKQGETIGIMKRRGDMFGEMGVIDGSPRSASIMAVEETVCLCVDASFVDQMPEKDRIAFNYILFKVFAEVLASRLRRADDELIKAKDENALLRAEVASLKARLDNR